MTTTIPYGNNLILPDDILNRYRIETGTPVRVISTHTGILLIPLTQEPMSEQLAREIEEWQTLGSEALPAFPYESEDE